MGMIDFTEIIGLLLGGCSLGSIFTIRYARRQALGEARSAENEATKAVQDIYQEMIEDFRRDREEQKTYLSELKEDRNHLRKDRDELRIENSTLRKGMKTLQDEVQEVKNEQVRQGRKIEVITPFICGRTDCTERLRATIKELVAKKKNSKEENKTDK